MMKESRADHGPRQRRSLAWALPNRSLARRPNWPSLPGRDLDKRVRRSPSSSLGLLDRHATSAPWRRSTPPSQLGELWTSSISSHAIAFFRNNELRAVPRDQPRNFLMTNISVYSFVSVAQRPAHDGARRRELTYLLRRKVIPPTIYGRRQAALEASVPLQAMDPARHSRHSRLGMADQTLAATHRRLPLQGPSWTIYSPLRRHVTSRCRRLGRLPPVRTRPRRHRRVHHVDAG